MTTTLTLFDLDDLAPATLTKPEQQCCRCQQRPATTRTYAARNMIGVCPAYLYDTWFRDVTYRVGSGPCCDDCAWYLASAWWNPSRSCSKGGCRLWAHTLADPQPGWDCNRCHYERAIVWLAPLGVAS